MLNAVIRLSLRHRGLVLIIALVVMGYGGYLSTQLPIDVFPDLDRPRVVLLTEAPGRSPDDVETQISQPIETAMLGAPGVQTVRSQSSNGLVVTYVEFDWNVEIRAARQTVQERLTTIAGTLPDDIRPLMTPPASIMGQIMHVGVSRPGAGSDDLKQRMQLRTLADWVIRPRLLREPGVAEVIVLGGDRKQYQVRVNPLKLLEYGVTLVELEQVLKDNNVNASGGFTEEAQVERSIRVLGRLGPEPEKVLDDLRNLPVKDLGPRSVLLRHLAHVEEAPAPKRGDAGVNGHDGIIITIVKQPHADTRAVTERVKVALDEIQATLPKDVVIDSELFQLRTFIDRGVYYVGEALVIGSILVVIVLFLFLLNFRTTFITLTAIPLSLVITTLVFRFIGWITGTELSINVMTLGGIAVAMGELVDDAIVDVENIFRRLRENSALAQPRHPLVVVYDASREVRSAIVFGTAVVVLAFVPLLALSGIEGRLFVPLGLAYIISILASLLVSLTVTPVLSYALLPQSRAAHGHTDGFLLRGLKWAAGYLIRFSMKFAGPLLVLTWVIVGICVWQMTRLGSDFLPKFDEGSIQINVSLPSGASLQSSNEAAVLIDDKLRARTRSRTKPDGVIVDFIRRTGRAELDEHAEPVSRSEYILSISPDAMGQRDELLKTLLAELREEVPGVEFEAEQPLAHLISHMLSGVNAQIAIKVYGDDLNKLQTIANQIKLAISDVPGMTPPIIEPQETVDELHIILRPDDLAFYGLSRAYVTEFVQTAMRGEAVSQVIEEQRRFELVVKLREPERVDYRKLRELRLDLPGGKKRIRLGDVADIPDGSGGPNQVNRENVRRRAVVRCNVSGRDLGGVVADIEKRVKERIELPQGYFIEYGGQFEAQRSATLKIAVLAVVSFLGMFVVLFMLFPSSKAGPMIVVSAAIGGACAALGYFLGLPLQYLAGVACAGFIVTAMFFPSSRVVLQILNAIPTAFIGGVLALLVTNQTLTVASLVGFVSLGGIAVRNGILLVTHYFHLMKEEGETFSKEMILRGSLERLSPVLMTALTAGIGLVPLVVGGQKPGLEILYPVATVILGGLLTSTFCEFLIHPGIFWKFSGPNAGSMTETDESVI